MPTFHTLQDLFFNYIAYRYEENLNSDCVNIYNYHKYVNIDWDCNEANPQIY